MSPSKQPSGAAGDNVGQAHESMPATAARIFSNYILVPSRRHPDETSPTPTLQGAALLVFADEPLQQIKLGHRDDAKVGVDAGLRPAEDISDEFVSSHDISRKEVETMANEIHCSACDAAIQPGTQFCPRCGLQLVAQAAPAVYVEKARYSIWAVLAVCLIAIFIGANILSRHDAAKAASAEQDLATAVQSGALNTLAQFEARCGVPHWTKTTSIGDELHYFTGGQDYYVTLASTGPIFESEQFANGHTYRVKMEPAGALHKLGCR